MSCRSRHFAVVSVAAVLSFCPAAFAADPPKPAAPPAAPAAADAAPKASITSVTCENLTVHVAWSGSGVTIVDANGGGTPVLAVRADPQPSQTSSDLALTKEWEGRKIDVRIWDKDVKLLDTKSTECKAKS